MAVVLLTGWIGDTSQEPTVAILLSISKQVRSVRLLRECKMALH